MASGYESEELFDFNRSGPEDGDDYCPQNQAELYVPSDSDPDNQSQGTKEEGNEEQSSESSDDVPRWYYKTSRLQNAVRCVSMKMRAIKVTGKN